MDPDGSALKLDRFLWTIPRLLAIEQNGDPVHAAPTALRSLGFTVVRHKKAVETQDRIERQSSTRRAAVTDGDPPLLDTEDVTHGLRVEVWDDTAKRVVHAARTAHRRRGGRPRPGGRRPARGGLHPGHDGDRDAGRRQQPGARPRVDLRLGGLEPQRARDPGSGSGTRTATRSSRTQDANPDPVTPLVVTSEVETGTLPRLRYGRSYAFRAWAVDLAGNSRAHGIGPAPPPAAPAVAAISAALANVPATLPAELLIPTLRSETAAGILRRRFTVVEEPDEMAAAELSLLSRARTSSGSSSAGSARAAPRRSRVRGHGRRPPSIALRSWRARSATPSSTRRSRSSPTPRSAIPTLLARAIFAARARWGSSRCSSSTRSRRCGPSCGGTRCSRRRSSRDIASRAGESLRQLVVRSGVTQDLDTLEITVEPPDVLRGRASRSRLSRRQRAPSRAAQDEPERGRAARRVRRGDRVDQPRGPQEAARQSRCASPARCSTWTSRGSATRAFATRSRGSTSSHDPTVPASTLKTLPLPTGEAPAPGQYVVHDTDALVLPVPARRPRPWHLARLPGGRPRPDHRLPVRDRGLHCSLPRRLARAPALPARARGGGGARRASSTGTCCSISLPAGDVQRFRLASSLDRADLDLFGPWRSLPPVIRRTMTSPRPRPTAGSGRSPRSRRSRSCTPFPGRSRRRGRPRWSRSAPNQGATDVVLVGAVDVHGPSTESLTAEANWVDPVDDLSLPAPDERATPGDRVHDTDPRERGPRCPLRRRVGSPDHRARGSGRSGCTRRSTASATRGTTRSTTASAPPPGSASTSTRRPLAPPPAPALRGRSTTGRASSGPSSRSRCRARRGRQRPSSTPCCRSSAGRRAPSPSNRSRPGASAEPACGSTSSGPGTRPGRTSFSACCSPRRATTATRSDIQ